MTIRPILISLFCLGLLLITGCTPTLESVATVPATRPAATDTAPVPEATALPNTPFPQATLIPTVTPTLPAADLQATHTALAAAYTPPPTDTPTSTFTPIPGPVWRILFQAALCSATRSSCSNDLFMSEEPRWYLINSDGSGLVALENTGTFLADMWGYPHLSPDGTQLAYLARSEVDNELHIMLAEISSGNTTDLGLAPDVYRELKFLPEPDCLAIYSSPGWEEAPTVETLTVTKVCADSDERQILETIELPGLRPLANWYLLSPQGDALLILTRNMNDVPEAYIYEFGSQEPPHLLLAAEDETWSIGGPARWLPDGQEVEFFLQHLEPDGLVKVLLYASNRQGTNLRTNLELKLPFGFQGDWSPDGHEIAFFSVMNHRKPETTGIYIFDLETGAWRQILAGYYLVEGRTGAQSYLNLIREDYPDYKSRYAHLGTLMVRNNEHVIQE